MDQDFKYVYELAGGGRKGAVVPIVLLYRVYSDGTQLFEEAIYGAGVFAELDQAIDAAEAIGDELVARKNAELKERGKLN